MLRPATPLSALLFAAFGLLIIASLSTPIIKGIPLGSFNGVDYGVFGICKGDDCSSISLGYNTDDLTGDAAASFDIPESIRGSLSSILVVHPVAAVFTLAMLVMALMAHIHKFAHSSRYLLILFLLVFVDALLCILAFLTDALLFSPHLAFGTYFVLAAAIVASVCTVMSFFMRRTLVGRKSRQKRIAQNAEMSGENYYNREAQKAAAAAARQPTMPVLSGANGGGDTLPTFTSSSYESQKKEDQISDDNIPLTQRSPSNKSPPVIPAVAAYNEPRSNSVPLTDQYGNPNGPGDGPGVRRGPSFERMNSRGRGGMPPTSFRGRGGSYGRGGGYNGYGSPPNRGGYGTPRGGYGPPRGGYGGPPPPRGGMGMMRGGARSPTGYSPYDRQPSPADGYDSYGRPQNDPYGNTPGGSMPNLGSGGYNTYQPSERSSLPRAESPPPLPGSVGPQPMGELAEMDGTPAGRNGYGQQYGIRDSDADVAGMVALQQPPRIGDPRLSDGSGSRYSNNEDGDNGDFVPARAAWNQPTNGRGSPSVPAPLQVNRPDLPLQRTGPGTAPGAENTYYEDVEPRYAPAPPAAARQPLRNEASYDNMQIEGARSPADSDRSNFTSISQRGVNPNWNPPPPLPPYQGPPPRRPLPPTQRQDMLLNNNPDFQVPGNRPGPGGRGGGGAYPGL